MASKFKQEMPPQGGYGPIQWSRIIKPRRYNGFMVFGGMLGLTFMGYTIEKQYKRKNRIMELEMQDARLAMEPILFAERQRLLMRRLRENRDEENELMKDVPDWETGTLYGEPIYHNLAGRFPEVNLYEYYVHSRPKDMSDRIFERLAH